ncbi:MAG: tRNA (N6-isopentenyl adenosine(37)-C2)-methylthiotransferase MiaB [Deltaproteobacteria bacterium]|nr:tRNA (N6-isopentenyl adenosine(37)-C2)-methylthiotransferase MiaB [Deltaproteobacteria bacterium]
MVSVELGRSEDIGETARAATRFVHIQTFGCQMNVNDTDRILQVLAPHGWAATEDPAQAHLILLNTCSIREKAEQKMLSQLGRLAPLKEYNDELVLGVAGCVAQQEGAALLHKVPYLDLVMGPDHIAELPAMLERMKQGERRIAETELYKRKDFRFVEAEPREETKVSEFVTIMKGCDKVCSYCIVPFTRGREVSKTPEMVLREVEKLVASGAKEITLLGQNVNSYGKDLQSDDMGPLARRVPSFAQLIKQVDALPGVERIRFTTSHPMDAIDDLIALFGTVKSLCEFFHLPVQAGNDRVLEEMRRAYTIESYRETVRKLRAQCPDIALSTDIIVGFPGETDAEFEDTVRLLEEVRYDSIFAFKYSERPGTRAEKLGDTVPEATKKARLAKVLEVQERVTRDKMEAMGGKVVEVLIEGPSQRSAKGVGTNLQMMGRTRQNHIVNVPVPLGDFWSRRWVGKLAAVEITEVKSNTLFGRFI